MRRWFEVFLVAMFINTSYGTLSYAFSVLVTRSAAGGTFSPRAISLGFGAALLVSGLCAVLAGGISDLFGTRRLMAGGSVLGAIALALLAATQEAWQAILVMTLIMGPAMAATFYEPVYVLMNRWFTPGERPRAYGVLTFFSGFSITIFTPLTHWLVVELGWRQAVFILAGTLLVVGLTVPAVIRERVEARSNPTEALSLRRFGSELKEGVMAGDRRFWAFSMAFFASTVAFSGVSFHMVSQLEGRGFDESSVATAVALTGIVSLPARLLLPALTGRAPSTILLAACLILLGCASAIAATAAEWWQVWLYVGLFGAVFGAVYPLRALATAERYAGPYFGRLIGAQALLVAAGRALGPVLIGLAGTTRGAYQTSFLVASLAMVVCAFAAWFPMRGPRVVVLAESLPSART